MPNPRPQREALDAIAPKKPTDWPEEMRNPNCAYVVCLLKNGTPLSFRGVSHGDRAGSRQAAIFASAPRAKLTNPKEIVEAFFPALLCNGRRLQRVPLERVTRLRIAATMWKKKTGTLKVWFRQEGNGRSYPKLVAS